jgi:hypothetical protein
MHATNSTNSPNASSKAAEKPTRAPRSEGQHGSKSRRVLEAISSGFDTLHRIAEFTEIDYRTVNSLVFSLEQQGRLIANSNAIARRERRFQQADSGDARPMQAPSESDNRQACDFGLFGIGFLLGGMPPQLIVQSTRRISYS